MAFMGEDGDFNPIYPKQPARGSRSVPRRGIGELNPQSATGSPGMIEGGRYNFTFCRKLAAKLPLRAKPVKLCFVKNGNR